MNRALVLAVPLALGLLACSETTPLVQARCETDDDCDPGQLCDDGECVSRETFRCDAVTSGAAILQPEPHVVDFESVAATKSTQTITLRNIGDCALTVFEARLAAGADSPFVCQGCGDEALPVEIFPMREHTITIEFTPAAVGSYSDKLEILSDDVEFPQLEVPLRARFDGVPELRATPDSVDFGYVAMGREGSRGMRLANSGTGVANLGIVAVRIEPATSDAFSIEGAPTERTELVPMEIDPRSGIGFTVNYHPRDVGSHSAFVVVETDNEAVGVVSYPLSGSSATPPVLSISPEAISFGEAQIGVPAPIQKLTLTNEGGSPLKVTHSWATGFSTDLTALPEVIGPIEPGQFVEIEILLTPTATGQISGVLSLESNDPSRGSVSVPVSALGVNQLGTQVVKVELAYENGSDSSFDDDLRDVDLSLEHPYGFVCNKQEPSPTSWGEFGTPTWLAYGAKEEPERIVLVDPQRDGKYRVMLSYVQDCSALPTELLASLLGLSVEALAAGLSSGTINLDGGDLSDMIDDACFNHSATTATVTVYVNGAVVGEVTTQLTSKGDFVFAADLVRQNGQFRVE